MVHSLVGGRYAHAAITAALMLGSSTVAYAEGEIDYPHDLVTLVTHSSAGGGGDVFLRDMIGPLSEIMGVEFVVENVVGGSGGAAIAYMAEAPADGSVIYASNPTYIFTSFLSDLDPNYTDLDPIVNVFYDPQVIFARADAPYETLEDAVSAAQEEDMVWAAGAAGALGRMAMEQVKQETGVDAAILTGEGGGETILSVLNGTADIAVGEVLELRSQLEAEEVKLLAVLTQERLAENPDLPTARELGIDVVVEKYRGLAGPAGLPDDVIAAWESAIQQLLEHPEYREMYTAASLEPAYLSNEEFRPFIDDFAASTEDFMISVGIIQE
jgi:tripartite-type tricarboxylate transporter receptor subunit TctC